MLILLGILTYPLTSMLQFIGLSFTSASSATTVIGIEPVMITIVGFIFFKEKASPIVFLLGIAVKEKGDDIVFLRKIVKGGADKSYGIQVAKLAGVPESVINRAKEIVGELSDADITTRVRDLTVQNQESKRKVKTKKYDDVDLAQISLFDTVKDDDVLKELEELEVSNMTPMDALNTIYRLQNKLKNRWG